MKYYILPAILFCFSLTVPFYFPEIRWLFAEGYIEKGSIEKSCSVDQKYCVDFKIIVRGDPPYRNGYITITDEKNGKHVEINNYFMDIQDHDLEPSQMVWRENNQLDVYLEGKKDGSISSFFFKDLGNLSVIIHRNY